MYHCGVGEEKTKCIFLAIEVRVTEKALAECCEGESELLPFFLKRHDDRVEDWMEKGARKVFELRILTSKINILSCVGWDKMGYWVEGTRCGDVHKC